MGLAGWGEAGVGRQGVEVGLGGGCEGEGGGWVGVAIDGEGVLVLGVVFIWGGGDGMGLTRGQSVPVVR